MFKKLVHLTEEITLTLKDIPIPVKYHHLVIQKTLSLISPPYLFLNLKHDPQALIQEAPEARENTIHQDIVLIERIMTHIHNVMKSLTPLIEHSYFGKKTNKMLDQLIVELAILEHIPIIQATEDSVAVLEAAISTLVQKRKRYANVFEILETKATLERLNIKNYSGLPPSAKTLVLLRSFAIGVLLQTFNGFEMIQHETCIEFGKCENKAFYTELLPALLSGSILFHDSLEKSLRILLTWVEQDYLHANSSPLR
jgi:hypothetical protein